MVIRDWANTPLIYLVACPHFIVCYGSLSAIKVANYKGALPDGHGPKSNNPHPIITVLHTPY